MLIVGGLRVDRLAATYDTPLYVTDADIITAQYQAMQQAFARHPQVTIAYAVKANTALAILALLQRAGAATDVVSVGEAQIARRAGFSPQRIFFTGTSPRTDELQWLAREGVAINLDSLSMAERLLPFVTGGTFGVRINPGVGAGHHEHVVTGAEETKFGLHMETLPALCDLLHRHGHQLTRLQAHIGSGITDPDPFLILIDAMHRAHQCIAHHPAVAIDTIDLGGGFGIPYQPGEPPLDLQALGGTVVARFQECFGGERHLLLEPGRYLVAESTVLLTRVTTLKPTPHVTFAGVDAGFHTLLRPILYNAYHHIVAAERMDAPTDQRYTICGPICETGDLFGRQRSLPTLREGDLLAICDTGAYGAAMSSTYNSRPRPAEILVHAGTAHLMRTRETIDDVVRRDQLPSFLASSS